MLHIDIEIIPKLARNLHTRMDLICSGLAL